MAHDVFISHSSKDKVVADATCAWLEARGIRCWVAPRDIRPGASWGASIVNAIRSSRAMILIFSGHANASPQIVREVERAVNFGVTIIPVRIENVLPKGDMEYFLGVPHWLDAMNLPLESHLDGLVSVVNEILTLPSNAVIAPLPEEAIVEPLLEAQPQEATGRGQPSTPLPPPRKRMPLAWIAGAFLALTVLSALGWYLGIERPAEQEKLRQQETQQAIEKQRESEAQQAADAAQKARLDAQAKAAADEAKREKDAADVKAAADAAAAKAAADEKAKEEEAERLANARGGFVIETNPEGATVSLAGGPTQTTPAVFKNEKLGTYPVHITMDGYEPSDQTVEIKENQFTDLGAITLVRKAAPALALQPPQTNAPPLPVAAKPAPAPAQATAPAPASTHLIMYTEGNFPRGNVYNLPELPSLGTGDFSDDWFYGDLILKSKGDDFWTFHTYSIGGGLFFGVSSGQGSTVVEVEFPNGLIPNMRPGLVLSIMRDAPLELLSIHKSANGSLVVRARSRVRL